MQITHHTEKQVEPVNPANVAGTIKGIVPRSFEKTFSGLTTEQIGYAFKICLDGLTREQIANGIKMVRDNGFCPDPAMFRKWCLGVTGFVDANPIESSYRSKHSAIANIEKWLTKDDTVITNAEKLAYDKCSQMFSNLKWNYSDKQRFYTYEAFKGFYDEVVKELVAQGVYQCDWIKPPPIQYKEVVYEEPEPTEEQKESKRIALENLGKLLKR